MKFDKLSTAAQEGLRAWAAAIHGDDMLFDGIGSSPEHWAWIWLQLREAADFPEWFPQGKWVTIQAIEMYLIEEARGVYGGRANTGKHGQTL